MTRHSYLYLLLLLCLSACQSDESTPDLNIDISDELQIEFWEVLDASQRRIELRVTTLENLDCENYSISFTNNQTGNRSIISIDNILPPLECISGAAPASNQINLGHFFEGNHDIELNLKNNEIINIGQLKVKPRYYELDMESDYGFFLPWKILNTVPEELMWGYLMIEETADQDAILEAFNNRISLSTESISLPQGEYAHFKIESGNVTTIKDQRETITNNTFLFEQNATTLELREALDELRNEFTDQMSIKVFLSDGSVL